MVLAHTFTGLISGPTINAALGKYDIWDFKSNWTFSHVYCEKSGGHQVALETVEEYDRLSSHIPAKTLYFIGLNDIDKEGSFVWYHSNEKLGKYQPWIKIPSLNDTSANCVSMVSGKWKNLPCSDGSYFICEYKYAINGSVASSMASGSKSISLPKMQANSSKTF